VAFGDTILYAHWTTFAAFGVLVATVSAVVTWLLFGKGDNAPAPNRRWSRFSLRTLFVVVTVFAIAAGWIGRSLDWMRQRHEAVEQWVASTEDDFSVDRNGLIVEPPVRNAPGMLWVFGEPGYAWIKLSFPIRHGWELTDDQQSEVERIKKLFPEARVELHATPVRRPGDYDGFKL
jgi:hypothetical protein